MNISIITIDGPTASGKGTVARIVAEKLHFHYLDSGALYRLTALSVMRSGINPDDTDQIAETARHMPCRFEKERIFLGNEDVTDAIRVTQGATHKIIHIEVEIELPEVIGNGDGAFDPDLEEWEDIDVDIPM